MHENRIASSAVVKLQNKHSLSKMAGVLKAVEAFKFPDVILYISEVYLDTLLYLGSNHIFIYLFIYLFYLWQYTSNETAC